MTKLVHGIYITTNVASLFPREDDVFNNYISCFKKQFLAAKYEFVAIHFQEMGRKVGLQLDECIKFLQDFREMIFSDYTNAIVMIDSSFEDKDTYTALCNMYIWRDINLSIYNFETSQFEPAEKFSRRKFIYTYKKDVVCSKHFKYQLDMLPYGKNSRKGFTITNFHFGKKSKAFSLVNLHLVHDMTFELSPRDGSLKYCANFRKMEYELIESELKRMKIFGAVLFGDFNFRTNEMILIKDCEPDFQIEIDKTAEVRTFLTIKDNNIIATANSSQFCLDKGYNPVSGRIQSYIKSDTEGSLLLKSGQFYEFPKNFKPTYCFKKNDDGTDIYVDNRVPSYCDRIFLYGKNFIKSCLTKKSLQTPAYFILDDSLFLSDHKPVCVQLNLKK